MTSGGTNTTHTLQERYSSLVLAKIRQELVLKAVSYTHLRAHETVY